MSYTQLTEEQHKQLINATQAYQAMQSFTSAAHAYRGGMIWRRQSGAEYLVKTSPDGSQRGMGVLSPETERIAEAFHRNKSRAEERLKASKQRLEQEARLNRALRIGRCPNLVIEILNRLQKADLAQHFMVIGTNALYAYESGTGVVFNSSITETRDLDILWNSSKRRPASLFDDKEPQQLEPNEKDIHAVKIRNMDWLLSSPPYKQMAVGMNGKMAEMHAPDPRAFAMFKHWLSQQPERDSTKKRRDLGQAEAVKLLVEEFMPHIPFPDLAGFPNG